ncbi:discoidin domain-containing protein [Clostridium sp. D53t1_180928_C8]|uniref:discoidin domain-containing protein n=1 Tax=Clostridium sp. D53t1_180928_C8 TaxID=2787101 RepID=UPI0018AB9D00|nr:discoidin domain-containing protein [Clostridium sp. D53t1_180928_C8]
MLKRKLATLILAATITNLVATPANVFAQDLRNGEVVKTVEDQSSQKGIDAIVSNFGVSDENLQKYNEAFKIDNSKIIRASNTGGTSNKTNINNVLDGRVDTFWESGSVNTSTYNNEVEFEFDETVTINRVVYSAKRGTNRGFIQEFEIYASSISEGEFELISKGQATPTQEAVEFKFNPTTVKKIKIVYKKGVEGWAAASEFGFYKEDSVKNKVQRLFTDNTYSVVNEEFNTIDKIEALEQEVKSHVLYSDFKEDIDNAKLLIQRGEVVATEAKVSKFKASGDNLESYNKQFKVSRESIIKASNTGGTSNQTRIENVLDGNLDTFWESGRVNTSSYNNEVEFEFDEVKRINRIVYSTRRNMNRGFAQEFEIYASPTTKGDTFKLISNGKANVTQDTLEFEFDPTDVKRIKFVYKKSVENWAAASEFGFYKEDVIQDKVERLFTDETLSKVSDEFNTIEKINALEEEVKLHPLYEVFKEDIENAKILLEQQKNDATKADISRFDIFYGNSLDNYNSKFKMDNANISNIYTNGGNFGRYAADRMLDGDINTFWETGKHNSDSFKNEIIFTLKEATILDRMVYRSAGNIVGFAEDFEIWASTTTKGDTFQLVTTGQVNRTSDMMEFKFNPTKFKRIKFVYNKSYGNNATASEVMFYKEDIVSKKISSIFTDGTMSKLKPEYNNMESIIQLEAEVNNHPLREIYMKIIELAKEILEGNVNYSENTFTLKQLGDTHSKATRQLSMSSLGNDFQSTGIVAKPGEVFNIYVEIDDGAPTPEIVFTQQEGHYGNWRRNYKLKKGLNTIVVPKIYDERWSQKSTPGGAVYLVNKYTPDNQGKAPVVRIEGGEKFPLFNDGDNVEKFLEELKVYTEKLNQNPDTMVDIFEYNSKRVMFTGTAKAAYQVYINEGVDVNESINVWNDNLEQGFKFAGLKDDPSDPANDSTNIRATMRLMQPFGSAYAAGDHMGYQRHVMPVFLRTDISSIKSIVWGTMHETGHQMDIPARTWGEITNNMWANQAAIRTGRGDSVDYNSIYKNLAPEESLKGFEEFGYFEKLGVFWQLQIMKDTYWAELESMYRERKPSVKDYQEKKDILAKYSSEIMGVNLTKYYEKYKFTLSEECKAELAKLPDLDVKPWYLHTTAMNYAGNGFNNDINISVKSTLDEANKTATLKFNIDESNKNDLLGYEIKKDGKVIGFTVGNSFIVKDVDVNQNASYEVIAYAKDLSTTKGIVVNTFTPSLIVKQDTISVAVNEQINYKEYVKALNYLGKDISSNIQFESDVNLNKVGIYNVTCTVTDRDITVSDNIKVEVVSGYDYLSDYEWKSATTGYSPSPARRNKNIKVRQLGEIKTFEKGFGVHANGKIVYDLSDKNYERFEAILGVDMGIVAQNNTSIEFKIIADGQVLASTGIIKHANDAVYVNVPIEGVQELVLEVSGGKDGISCDHAVIANPKLIKHNVEEQINREELDSLITTINGLNGEDYTVDSFNNLQVVLANLNEALLDGYNQEEVNLLTLDLRKAYDALEENVDLSKVINIPDSNLKNIIKEELGLTGNDITIRDMHELITLTCGFKRDSIRSLEGLQYAKNLEVLNISDNEVRDLSPLKNLKKLTMLNIEPQFIVNGMLYEDNKNITFKDGVINRKGEKVLPKEIAISNNVTNEETTFNIQDVIKEDGSISFTTEKLTVGYYSLVLVYENKEDNHSVYSYYMFQVN